MMNDDNTEELTFRVQWGAEVKGPYGVAALRTLINRGAVARHTMLSATGSDAWVRADEIPEVAALLRDRVPATVVMSAGAPLGPQLGVMPTPPAPPAKESSKPKRVRTLLIAVGVGVASLAVLVGGVVFAATISSEPVFPEAVLEDGLPSQVETLVAIQVPTAEDQQVRGLRVSALAPYCGGVDIGRRLLEARGEEPDALLANGTLGLLQGATRRESLRCADGIASALQTSYFTYMVFDEAEESRGIALLPLSELDDPPFSLSHNFSGLSGRCGPDDETPSECGPEYSATVRREGWWAFGRGASVAAFARQWNRGAERPDTTNMEYARLLAEEIDPQSQVSIVMVRPDALPFVDICEAVPGGVPECLPNEVADTLTRVRTSTRAVSVAVRQPDPDIFEPEVRWTMSFAARDEADAEDVSRDLEELVRDWRAHLDNREAGFVETIRESGDDDMDRQEAMLRAFVRAMTAAEVQVDGRIASIFAEDELTDAEQREVTAYLAELRDHRIAASRVVLAVLADERPDLADLDALVGEGPAAWMLEPRATAEHCEEIRAHIASFSAPGAPPQDFGALFRLGQRFAEGTCAGTVLPQAISTCLTGATSATVMEACPVAAPPWQEQAVPQVIQGTLTSGDRRVPDDQSPYDEYPVQLRAGSTVTIEMHSDEFNPYLWLISPSGTSLVQDDDGSAGQDSLIRYRAETAGQYVVRANSALGAGRGMYTVTIRVE